MMTIALGVLATDGIVLAADTEVSWSNNRKTEGAKIALWPDEGLAITGAGDVNYLEALFQEIYAAIESAKTTSVGRIRQKVQAALRKFQYDHVLPWNDPLLDVSLVIALQRGGARVLWVTHKATIRPVVCGAIGVGSAEADALFVQLFGLEKRPLLDLDTAYRIAAYVTHIAKDRIPGCGKSTDMVLIAGGKAEHLSRATVGFVEQDILDFLELQNRLTQFALGYLRIDDEHEAAGHLARFFASARERYRETPGYRADSERWTLGDVPGRMVLKGDLFIAEPTPSSRPPNQLAPTDRSSPRRSTHGRTRRPPSRE